MEPIQLFVPKFRVDECLKEIRECLERGWTGLGYKTNTIEERWKEYTGLSNAHFLNSATSGLHLAIKLLREREGWLDGDEIITTPLTFVSTNHTILYERLTPVFADIDKYLCLDPDSICKNISPKTRAILFMGMGGSTGQYKKIVDICRENGLYLIVDAAHMAGTRLNGEHIGQEADVVVFSFQAVKNMPTADSGMICFADDKLDKLVREWSWMGINKNTFERTSENYYKWQYGVDHIGYKYHGNSIMASLALISLKYLDQDNAYRRQIAKWYDACLDQDCFIKQIPNPDGCESSRHLYQVLVNDRNKIIGKLREKGIYPGVHYQNNMDYFMYCRYGGLGDCTQAEKASKMLLSLPMHLNLTYNDVIRVSEELNILAKRG